jgi:hypothetical protein
VVRWAVILWLRFRDLGEDQGFLLFSPLRSVCFCVELDKSGRISTSRRFSFHVSLAMRLKSGFNTGHCMVLRRSRL